MGAMSRDEFEAFADEWQQTGGWQVPAHVVTDLIDTVRLVATIRGATITEDSLIAALKAGHLIPVSVFGAEDGYGLCDENWGIGGVGSDCNRARDFLMRPTDDLMTDRLRTAIAGVREV